MPLPLLATGAIALATEFAPSLIRWIVGDEAGDVAKRVVDIAKTVTGQDDPDSAAAAIRANPELALAFKTKLLDVELEMERLHAADRASARDRETKTGDSWTPRVLAAITVGGFFAIVYSILSGMAVFPKEYEFLAGTLIGVAGAEFTRIMTYYFGSSAGSKEKTSLLGRGK